MIPTDKELDKVFSLFRKYTKLEVYEQTRLSLFDYIKRNWDNG